MQPYTHEINQYKPVIYTLDLLHHLLVVNLVFMKNFHNTKSFDSLADKNQKNSKSIVVK